MHGGARGERRGVGHPHHLVGELDANRRQHRAPGSHFDVVVVLRRFAIRAVRFDPRQREAVDFHLAIVPARFAQQVGTPDFEPDEVVGVIDDAHLVGFGVAHADSRRGVRGGSRAHRGTVVVAPRAARFSSRVARSGLGAWNMADPATMMLAPAATTRPTLWLSMPPSISTGAALPARSSSARTSRTLDSLRGMKVCPPNPGFTDMTRTKSTSPAISSRAPTGVAGLITTPALTPNALMACTVLCRWGRTSTWTEIR